MFVKHVLWSRIGRLVTVGTLWALLWRTLWARDTERSDGEKWGEERVGVGAGAGWKTAAGLNDCSMGMQETYWRRMSAAAFFSFICRLQVASHWKVWTRCLRPKRQLVILCDADLLQTLQNVPAVICRDISFPWITPSVSPTSYWDGV